MNNITTLILLISLFLASCGGGGGSTSSSDEQQTVVEGNKTTITRIVNAESGATLSFQDGVSLEIPANALPSDTAISITKDDKNSLFIFNPDGLVSSSPLTLEIPVTSEITNDSSQVINVYILSNESPLLDLGTEQIKAEKLVTTLAGNLQEGSTLDVQFSHFSQIRRVTQAPLYLSFFLPSKYLQSGDILTFLSAENYLTNTDGFDWFPGHIAMLTNPNGEDCIINGKLFKCDMVEAMPPKVRVWNLFEGSAYEENHVYMGARRPKTNTLSEIEKNSVVTFSKNQIDKPWALVNSDEWLSSKLTEFSCVGLVEAAYESIGKGLLNDFSFFDSALGNPPFPLDMYEVTTPVNEISEVVGNSIEIRVNPVYQVVKPAGTIPGTSLQYGYGAYDDYRNIGVSTTSNFSFTASNLPEGATFDPSTGIFQWNNIPEIFANSSHTVTFNLSNSYPTTFGGSSNASISETLKVNIAEAPVASLETPDDLTNLFDTSEFLLGQGSAGAEIIDIDTPSGAAVKFIQGQESRIQFSLGSQIPKEGTLEMRIKVNSGFDYNDYNLSTGNDHALIFTTDVQHGDVTYPGSTWLYVNRNGNLSLRMATAKYGSQPAQSIGVENTDFTFDEWHTVSISYGSEGQYLMLDGQIVASSVNNTQVLGAGGTHSEPVDIPTIGESVPGFWSDNQYEGGFEGYLDGVRISPDQQDFKLNGYVSNK